MTNYQAAADLIVEPAPGQSTTLPAISYVANGDTWTILQGVTVASTNNAAVFSDFNDSRLINHGSISSGSNIGVVFRNGNGGVVTNAANAWIVGLQSGVWFGGVASSTTNSLENDGSIVGMRFYGVLFVFGSGGTFNNRGDVFGSASGVRVESSLTTVPVSITNDGDITSAKVGISILYTADKVTTIVNGATGAIVGPEAAIKTSAKGKIDLENHGLVDGPIDLTLADANDRVLNTGSINGETRLGPGNDAFVFAGGKQGTVFGQAGADRFDFVSKLAKKKDAAVIGDFTPGEDTIGLSKALFKKIGKEGPLKNKYFEVGKKAKDKDAHVIWDQASGNLFYDKDGKGGDGQKLVAKLTPDLDLSASDILVIA